MSEQPGLVALQERVAELEFKLSYQENTLEALEKASAYQQQSIQSLERKLRLLAEHLTSLRDDPIKPLSEETPPPHY